MYYGLSSDWPSVGTDRSLVGSVISPGYEVCSRVFVPLIAARMQPISWSSVADRVGVELAADTTWDQLGSHLGGNPDHPRRQFGAVDRRTLDGLLAVLSDEVRSLWTTIALWQVYDDLRFADDLALAPIPRVAGSDRWHDGAHVAARILLPDLTRFVFESGARFPSAVVPEHGEFLLASPGYSDSLYLSSSRRAYEALSRAYDLREVDGRSRLPAGELAG